jgi:hypothetical protein
MSIRTVSDLASQLQDDLGWRRKELSVFHGIVTASQSSKRQAILRGAIAALYAHWEGFIKTAAQLYIDFVRQRRLNLCDLSPCFMAMAARKKLLTLQGAGSADSHIDLANWLTEEWRKRATLPGPEIISTSNLNSKVFGIVIRSIGLTYRTEFAIAEKPVIQRLVEIRNSLAHGEWQVVDAAEYEQLYHEIDKLLVLVCNDVEYAASQGLYRKTTHLPSGSAMTSQFQT